MILTEDPEDKGTGSTGTGGQVGGTGTGGGEGVTGSPELKPHPRLSTAQNQPDYPGPRRAPVRHMLGAPGI